MVRKRHDEQEPVVAGQGSPEGAANDRLLSPDLGPGEKNAEAALRPKSFDEYVGQYELVENLRVFVRAAQLRGEALDHILFTGPPGLGKTTMAHVIARELGTNLHVTSGPAIDKKGDLAGILTSLAERDVIFIDEIHRLSPIVEENLYPAMEDYRLDLFIGDGPHARSVAMKLPRFTLLAATTRVGLLSAPLRDRFGYVAAFRYYPQDDLGMIVKRSARLLGISAAEDGAREVARRARGTPRVAPRLRRRVRDFAQVHGDGRVTSEIADYALRRLEVDAAGLDGMDRAYLQVVIERFDGGPVGIEAMAASLGQERDTLEDWIEPFLVQEGYIARTPRGRMATAKAYQHLGLAKPRGSDSNTSD
ncbi:MAG: Holliday junction branch migration DNA helicase RuvB [Pseudomonadota bacterium]